MKFKRTRYQFGSVELKPRKHGPAVWDYRFRELQPDGTVKHRSVPIGTVAQYPTKSHARKAAEVYRLAANPDKPAQHGVSWGALIDRYEAVEMPRRKSTSRHYRCLLEQHIRPKWGDYALADVTPFACEEWLRKAKRIDGSASLAPKTKKHLRSRMHHLYTCAMRWGFVAPGTNPFEKGLVRIENASKPLKKRRSLTLKQWHEFLKLKLIRVEPFRTMFITAAALGLRRSEVMALRRSDFNWERLTVSISRGIVDGEIDQPKSLPSQTDLPLAAELAEVIWRWMQRSPFKGEDDFLFAGPFQGGKAPYDPDHIQATRLRPAGIAIGFQDSLGWHNLRHTYRTLLDETGAPITVQQELMRHADIRTTLDYGEALSDSKRNANKKVVTMLLGASGRNGKGKNGNGKGKNGNGKRKRSGR